MVSRQYEKIGFNGHVYDFSVDCNAIDVDDIKDIHNYWMKKNYIVEMKIFGFVKKAFFVGLTILSSFTNANSLSYIIMNNQVCKTRPQVVNVNGDEPVVFPFSIETSKCNGSCKNINYPYAKICVPDLVKNLNVKVLNQMSRTNKMRHKEWHESINVSVNLGLIFVIINNARIKINADVNANN